VRTGALIVGTALAAAVVAGAVLFPRSEEPGRADSAGIRLNVVVGGSLNGVQNDWYLAGVQQAKTAAGALHLIPGSGPLQVVTRPLPVFADTCYTAHVRARARGHAHFQLAVTDEEIRRVIASLKLPASTGFTDRTVRFDSGDRRRIAFAVLSGPHGRLVLTDASLVRDGAC
jgi:hypothetical protein